ncbi:MAG: PAS domain S-box protein [Chloroflexi bacterium]|nr:PAS domain S-box protein [Chloroflexota bacterium]
MRQDRVGSRIVDGIASPGRQPRRDEGVRDAQGDDSTEPDGALDGASDGRGSIPPVGASNIDLSADLRSILEGIAAGVTVQDERGQLLFVNVDAAQLSGFRSPDEMLAASPGELLARFELVDEEGGPFPFERLPGRRVLADDTAEPVLIGFRLRADGAERWSMVRARLALLADGRRVAINTFHDVTPRIETERRIRASELRTRSLAEARRRDEELARHLADTSLRLDEARDIATVVQLAADASIPILADWCVVDLLESDGSLRRVGLAARGDELRALVEPLRNHPSVQSPNRVSRRAVSDRSSIVVPDVEAFWAADAEPDHDLRRILRATGLRSVIAEPLIARGEVIGTIVFATVGERTHDQLAGAATAEMASRIGIAIANTVSYVAELRARHAAEMLAERMERLQAVTRILAEVATVDDVIAIIIDEARRAFGADGAAVALLDETATGLVVVEQAGDSVVATAGGRVALASDLPIASAVRENRPIWPAVSETAVADGAASDESASEWAVPLVADQAPLGALALRFGEPRVLRPEDERLVRAYADLGAGAIARLRLGTLRRQLLAANEAERARLESVLRQMPVGVILAAAPDGRVLYANEAAQRQSPMPIEVGRQPAYGRTAGFAADGSRLADDAWPMRRAMAGETVKNEVVEVAHDDGTRQSFAMSAAPIPSPAGDVRSAVLTFSNVTDQIRARARETFLARASEVLASSLDYEKTVQAVADLVVPSFADWCVVHVAGEEGLSQRIAVAHRDPAMVALAVRLQNEYPPDPDATTGTAAVMRTGKPEFMADIPPEIVDAAARNDAHRDILRSLSLRSYVAVPLIASGRISGVLTLVGSEPGHRFEATDLAFAESLASRAAAAIENARLFREGVRFKRLLDAIGDAVLMLDPADGRILYANRGATEQFGRPLAELGGSPIGEHVAGSDGAALTATIAAMARSGADARTETVSIRRPDGVPLPVEVRLESVALDGAPARILAIARDIRDRIRAQESLRELAAAEHARAAELNGVITAMGDGVVMCDRDGQIILANPAAEAVFPDVEEQSYAEILAELEDPDDEAPVLGRRGGPVELRVRGTDERWVELSTWPVGANRTDDGEHDETIVVLRDVTNQRQRQIVRDTFIGVLSHELRTPVTTIYAGAKVLARPNDLGEDTRREIFDDIVVESERLHRLVEDVVAMTRFGDEDGDVGAEPVLLQRLLPLMVASEQARWPGVTFEATVAQGLPTVTADPTYVEQVVRNLLSNAAKYSGAGSLVTAEATPVGSEVQVRILDDGPGFPADEADRLFDLFFRSAGTSRSAPGAGIGLFVCARLIRAMGGRIWASNRPAGGAEFGFALRVMDEDD